MHCSVVELRRFSNIDNNLTHENTIFILYLKVSDRNEPSFCLYMPDFIDANQSNFKEHINTSSQLFFTDMFYIPDKWSYLFYYIVIT